MHHSMANNLVDRLISGEEAAYRETVGTYSSNVFNTALAILQNQEDAEDISQEVFIELFRSVSRFRGESSLSTWIYRITVTKSLEHIRKNSRKKRSGLFTRILGTEKTVDISTVDPFYHPGISLENRERSAILFKAIEKLPDNQKIAFLLHKVEGLAQAEIADIMKLSVSAVESLIVRAKQKLKSLLSVYYDNNWI
jgi:RNA polymerase sigma-70 factor (ECF subfamily)